VIVALLMMMLLGALGGALTFIAIGETRITGNYRTNTAAIYAAEAAVEIVLNHLVTVPDWRTLHAGIFASTFIDGAPSGVRNTAAGPIDLARETDLVRSSPPGRAWQLYAYGPLRDLASVPARQSDIYVVVWVASHPAGAASDSAVLLAHAYAPYGMRRAIEATVARTPISGVRVTCWREQH
jgi:hypothetical protein